MRVGQDAVSQDDQVTAFDAAAYAFEIAGELSNMSRKAGLERLRDALERVRDAAAQEMIDLRKSRPKP